MSFKNYETDGKQKKMKVYSVKRKLLPLNLPSG